MTDPTVRGALPEAGWFSDPYEPSQERLWTGTTWSESTRRPDPMRQEPTPTAWHNDPSVPGQERLWDGESWTSHTRPLVSPAAPGSPAGRRAGVERAEKKNLAILGTIVSILLGLTIVANLATIVAKYDYLHYVNEILGGGHPAVSQVRQAVDATNQAGSAFSIALLLAAIAFIWWFHRAYRNLSARGIADLRFSSRWAIGGWLVPFLNLARPKAIANDIWKGSAGLAHGETNRWSARPIPALLNWWWGFWIAGSILSNSFVRFWGDGGPQGLSTRDVLHQERISIYLNLVGSVLLIVAALLAIAIVRRVSAMQDGHPDPHPGVAQQPILDSEVSF